MGLGDSQVALDILLNAVDNTKGGVEGATGRLGKLGDLIGIVGKTTMATAGAALAFGGVAVKVFTDAGTAAHEMSSKFGMTEKTASSWLAAGRSLSISNDTITTGFQMLTRTMNNLDMQFLTTGKLSKSQTEVFKELGVQIMDAKGRMRPLNDVMLDISTRFAAMPDGALKAGLAMKLFGRSGTDMIPFLDQGGAKLKEFMATAQQYGAVVGKDDVEATKAFHLQLAEMKLRGEGVMITFARGLMPALGTVFGVINGQGMPILLRFSQWFATEGAPRLQDFMTKAAVAGEKELPKLFNGAKGVLSQLQPLIDPLKQIAGQLVGLLPSVAQASNLMGAWGSASSAVPGVLNLVILGLKIAAPLIKVMADNVNVLIPMIYAFIAATTAWKVVSFANDLRVMALAYRSLAAEEGILAAVNSLLGISFGPVIIGIIAVGAVVGLLALAWKNNWGDIQGKTKVAIDFIGTLLAVVGPWLQQYVVAPLGAAVGWVRAHWDSIKAVIGIALGAIKAVVGYELPVVVTMFKVAWEVIKVVVGTAIELIRGTVSFFGPILKTWVINPMAAAVGFIKGHWDAIKAIIGDAVGMISNLFRGDMGGVVKSATDLFGRVASAIVGIFQNIHIPMPHFSFGGSMNPADWAAGRPPALNVQWYGSGGSFIANRPMLIGVGDGGAEAVTVRPLRGGDGGQPSSRAQEIHIHVILDGREIDRRLVRQMV